MIISFSQDSFHVCSIDWRTERRDRHVDHPRRRRPGEEDRFLGMSHQREEEEENGEEGKRKIF